LFGDFVTSFRSSNHLLLRRTLHLSVILFCHPDPAHGGTTITQT